MTERLDEIQARVRDSSSGPWDVSGQSVLSQVVRSIPVAQNVFSPWDADFIAHSREDVPYLLAEVTRLRAIIEEAKGLLTPTAFELDNGYTSKKALFAGQILDILAKATPEGGTK